jgi:membrane-associated phospholipid phosphatase
MDFWFFVTDLGDSAVTLPLAAVAALFLGLCGWRRTALSLLFAVGATGAAIGVLKLLLESCGRPLVGPGLTNPSGHMAMSTIVYGGLALLVARALPLRHRLWPWLAALVFLVLLALSRVIIHAHSPAETALGTATGALGLALLALLLGVEALPPLALAWLAVPALSVILAMHGTRWPIENWVKALVHLLRRQWPACGG